MRRRVLALTALALAAPASAATPPPHCATATPPPPRRRRRHPRAPPAAAPPPPARRRPRRPRRASHRRRRASSPRPPRRSPPATDPAPGLAWTLPPGWHAVESRLTSLADPAQRLAAASFDAPAGRAGSRLLAGNGAAADAARRCARAAAREPRGGGEPARAREAAATAAAVPARPRRRTRVLRPRLDRRLDRAGPRAPGRRPATARRASAGASDRPRRCSTRSPSSRSRRLRRRPGGASSSPAPTTRCASRPAGRRTALKRPKTTRRPRLLFRIANRDRSVVVRVVEHPRGPVSPAFPSAREPLVFDANRRAGMGWYGFRFSIRIVAGAGASARDLEWAEISGADARRLGRRAGVGLRCRPRSSPCRTSSRGGCAWGGR